MVVQDILKIFLRLILAGLLAGAIGFEREMNSKEAGVRTHFLVGIGSALFMIVSKYGFYDLLSHQSIGLDPSRIAAQVVSGIGFLGAGTIFLEKKIVKGLTTAAGIWATAAIGLAVGAGMYFIGIFSSVIVLIVLQLLKKINRLCCYRAFDITLKLSSTPDKKLMDILSKECYKISRLKTSKINDNNESIYVLEFVLKTKTFSTTSDISKELCSVDNIIYCDVENV
ncbi:MgtC/SapB family protein [Clostridium sp.]|uniref:MgtC/SapB family protein n=1 Tax=Clostridium sp. TaxID=1506 RepID=UPI0026DD4EFF|nr:MgtC/SapB family protein [Clostridium sp.]MDO5039791.1 MgtC/SapB family protein [Clostridium sp.]